MTNRNKALAGLIPFLVSGFIAMPSQAQAPSPLTQALSAASMTADEELSAATAKTVTKALTPKAQPPRPATGNTLLPLTPVDIEQAQEATKMLQPREMQAPPSQAAPTPQRSSEIRRTLFIEVAQRRLRMEAPLKMCLLDRTSFMQQDAYATVASAVEKNGDQVLLGIFMPCDNVSGPDGWSGGMPEAGFISWLNPSIGSTTPLARPDYLDMREASFLQYAQGRALGIRPDKAVHRNEYNVSLAFTDETTKFGATEKNTSIIATTLLRQVPVEITLHLTGDSYAKKAAPTFAEAYAIMDTFVAQLIKLNE